MAQKLTAEKDKIRPSVNNLRKQTNKQFSTPNRQACKKLDSLPLINCESIQYSASDSPMRKDPPIHPFKLFKTEATEEYERGDPSSGPKVNGSNDIKAKLA